MAMTAQEMFDKVWIGLKGQGFAASVDANNNCMYRSPKGLRCAAGHVLPDEMYTSNLEWKPCNEGTARDVFVSVVGAENIGILRECQFAHDTTGTSGGATIKERIENIARLHHLTIPGEP